MRRKEDVYSVSGNYRTLFRSARYSGSKAFAGRTTRTSCHSGIYPADWSPVCGDQMALYNEILSEFHRFHAELLGISVDGPWCHQAFAHDRKLRFPLLADFEPKGAIAKKYGAYREIEGVCERALFVIDGAGVIRWSYCSPVAINPGADGIIDALEQLGA